LNRNYDDTISLQQIKGYANIGIKKGIENNAFLSDL